MGFPNNESDSDSSNNNTTSESVANNNNRVFVNSCHVDSSNRHNTSRHTGAANDLNTDMDPINGDRDPAVADDTGVSGGGGGGGVGSRHQHPPGLLRHHNNSDLNDQHIVHLQMRDTLSAADVRRTVRGLWPVDSASFFATFFCCINFYTISRFSVLTYYFKGPFVIQFLILSIGFGLPFLLLTMSLGQYLGSGFYDMWFISPAFKGIGAAFLLTYMCYGLYSSVPIAWLFVYFRDAFMATSDSAYKWSYCNTRIATNNCLMALNSTSYDYIGWSVSSYFHGRVLDRSQRHQTKEVKIELSFHLCIVWTVICLTLIRGFHSTGRLLMVAAVVPLVLYSLVVLRFVEQWGDGVSEIFQTTGQPFLLDSMSWLMASREVFIIWVAFSAIALNVQSHNRSSHNIIKQILALFFLVTTVLLMSACLFASCMRTLTTKGLAYIPSSYEEIGSIQFVRPVQSNTDTGGNQKLATNGDVKILSAANLFLGENLVTYSEVSSHLSHYQVMRFATEVFPAALSVEGSHQIGSIWAVFFYLSAIMFTMGHLIVVWGSVCDAIVSIMPTFFKLWRPILTFVTCVLAFLMSLSMTSTAGLFVIYFLDFCIGSLWWLALLYLLMQISVLIIRGRPVGTENLVSMLAKDESTRSWLLPILTFQWNLIMPIATMILSIAFTRSYNASGLTWTQVVTFYTYWPDWTKSLSTVFQITPLFLVFFIGSIQLIVYLFPKQSTSLFHERIQALFCPTLSSFTSADGNGSSGAINTGYIPDDPPPKYEPPPSYSTATARHIVQQIRGRLTPTTGSIRMSFLSPRTAANSIANSNNNNNNNNTNGAVNCDNTNGAGGGGGGDGLVVVVNSHSSNNTTTNNINTNTITITTNNNNTTIGCSSDETIKCLETKYEEIATIANTIT